MKDEGYESKVWQRGPRDWVWKVKEAGTWTSPFAGGVVTSRRAANEAVRTAIADREAESGTRWRRVRA